MDLLIIPVYHQRQHTLHLTVPRVITHIIQYLLELLCQAVEGVGVGVLQPYTVVSDVQVVENVVWLRIVQQLMQIYETLQHLAPTCSCEDRPHQEVLDVCVSSLPRRNIIFVSSSTAWANPQ